jgi:hypothetical protein
MAQASRKVTIGKKQVTFSSRVLKSGEVAYFRAGRRATTTYQKRLAKGILEGKSPKEARGHLDFGAYESKKLRQSQIEESEEFHLDRWAQVPRNDRAGKSQREYYIKIMVTKESMNQRGSPTGDGDVCTPATLALKDPSTNDQRGFTFKSLAPRLEEILMFTLKRYRLTPCTGDLKKDILAIWRHS